MVPNEAADVCSGSPAYITSKCHERRRVCQEAASKERKKMENNGNSLNKVEIFLIQ